MHGLHMAQNITFIWWSRLFHGHIQDRWLGQFGSMVTFYMVSIQWLWSLNQIEIKTIGNLLSTLSICQPCVQVVKVCTAMSVVLHYYDFSGWTRSLFCLNMWLSGCWMTEAMLTNHFICIYLIADWSTPCWATTSSCSPSSIS